MMKRLMSLLRCVLADASTWCCTSSTRDLQTISGRVENEGLSFLTITLPTFGADFEKSLSQEYVDHISFPGFRRRGELPRFLGGFLDLVFDRRSGRLLESPSIEAIYFIRQITLMFKKIALPCTPRRERKAYAGYIQTEKDVESFEANLCESDLNRFGSMAFRLFSGVCNNIDRMVYTNSTTPKHGPGATADKLVGNNKFKITSWPVRLGNSFPIEEFVIPNTGCYEYLDNVDLLDPEQELPVRVISVPKTLKTPRIIAIEPTVMQYAQQALLREFVSSIEGDDFLSGAIGFTDQTPNQRLACLGSRDGSLATIDLSEASDRVSNRLAMSIFKNFPHLHDAVSDCRSLRADVPGYGIRTISKFASMGSALCFPVEAMVFLTLIALGMERKASRSLHRSEIKSLCETVRVYGDDMIIPVDIVREVVHELQSFGFKVNIRKSFWTGKFRESCGRDYYDGTDVTVTYVRRMLPSSLRNTQETISAFSLRNQLYKAGLWKSAKMLGQELSRFAPTPLVSEDSPITGFYSFLGYESQRYCRKLHKPLVKGIRVRPVPRKSPLSGVPALMKCLLKKGDSPFVDPKHLERYGRPESVGIKLGWAQPF